MTAQTSHITFPVGRYLVSIAPPVITEGVTLIALDWTPNMPGRPLSRQERRQYDEGLASALYAHLAPASNTLPAQNSKDGQ